MPHVLELLQRIPTELKPQRHSKRVRHRKPEMGWRARTLAGFDLADPRLSDTKSPS